MNTPLISNLHQASALARCGRADAAPWVWTLARDQASTLQAAPLRRWLLVEHGNLWLTQANGQDAAQDIWLAAGQSLELAAGSAWVLQGWPQAGLSLRLQAPDHPPAEGLPAFKRKLRGAWTAAFARLPGAQGLTMRHELRSDAAGTFS